MTYALEVKQAAYKIDPECWRSYSGKSVEVKRALDLRRTAALTAAQSKLGGANSIGEEMPKDTLAVIEGSVEHYRSYLEIDRNDLDRCLMEQPEMYYHVSHAFSVATGQRDSLKLDFEELQARLGLDIRDRAARHDEKLTEAGLQQKLTGDPKIQELQRKRLAKAQEAEGWQVLKEAFQQRSFMLRELVALYIAQRHDHNMEAGAGQSRTALAEKAREDAGKLRRERREPR